MNPFFTLILSMLVGLPGEPIDEANAPDHPIARSDWNREGAAAYLDARMDAWFANSKKLQTGQVETSCVSCHTTVPYLLSRPALRRAMRVSDATTHEVRLIDEATRRVETYDSHELLYEFDEDKKVQSRGTEAVLNALILTSGANQDGRTLSETTRKTFRQLWQTQRADGAWD